MELALISATAALASLATFFTGFGLATVLTPVMLVYFPPHTAIALTAVVHLLNNLFKYALTRHHIDWRTVLRFGAPAAIGALLGAALLLATAAAFAGAVAGNLLLKKISIRAVEIFVAAGVSLLGLSLALGLL